ncbi:MAG: mevalonate kinase [Desulfurococcales archaeon]|nr:mevalonate kinase [Desulfurococcales archaeon]
MSPEPRLAVASAPGKVILLGEHFVVRGSRALVASISLRVRVEVERRGSWPSIIESEGLGSRALLRRNLRLEGPAEFEPFKAILGLLHSRGWSLEPFRARITGGLPIGAGLGSSAAVSAAFALAYTALLGSPAPPRDLLELALEGERVVHENPSGVDSAIAVHGGFLVYRRGEEPRRVDLRLPEGSVLVIADSGIPRRTGDIVLHVLGRARAAGRASEALYRAADILIDEALNALREGDARRLGALMDLAHGMLAGLGASSRVLDGLVHAAREAGAYGAKLTGAGWGGSIIALVPGDAVERVRAALLGAGARWAEAVSLGGPGAVLERKT